jgi:UDP-N-acetylmuramoyl-L-alanyl-D-glutamate--2,6-diaminopimelate ligase
MLKRLWTRSIGNKTRARETHRYPNRGKAIVFALSLAKPGDLVIIAGKGHEQSLCRGKKEYPWSDQEEVRKILHFYGKK